MWCFWEITLAASSENTSRVGFWSLKREEGPEQVLSPERRQSRGQGDRSRGKDSLSVAHPDRPGPTPVIPPQDSKSSASGECKFVSRKGTVKGTG